MPVADHYVIPSGGALSAGMLPPSPPPPAWLAGAAPHQLITISGTAPSSAAGLVPAVSGSMGNQRDMVNAWCGGFRYRTRFGIHGGGHDGYGGNEIGDTDLAADSPSWDLLIERTLAANVLGGSNYYADGMPTSRHTYYAMFVANIDGQDKFLRLNGNMGFAYNGAPFGGSADVRTTAIDAFTMEGREWEPEEYGPMPRITGSETASAQHPETGNIYVWDTDNRISIFNVTTKTASDVVDLSGTEGQGAALVVDAVNNRLVRFAGRASGGVVYYPLGGGSKTTATLSGSGASALTSAMSGTQPGWGRAHDTTRNVVYLYTNASTIFRVDLSDFSVTQVTPTGDSLHTPTNNWWGRVQYIPALDVVVSLANWTSALQALRCA
jgi:hypothetical protein